MFRPLPLFIGLRYSLTRARKGNFLLSFVSLISMLGVSLGVLVLIVVLAVMNGSIAVLRAEALKSVPHVLLSGAAVDANWQAVAELAVADSQVLAAAPYMEGEATLRHQGEDSFVRLRGVGSGLEAAVLDGNSSRYQELLMDLEAQANGVILGIQLAAALGVRSGDEVSVLPLHSLIRRNFDDTQGLQLVGIADFGLYDNSNMAVINLSQAQSLFAADPGVSTALRLRVTDLFQAAAIAGRALRGAEVAQGVDVAGVEGIEDVEIAPWNITRANLFNALNMEKAMTGFMLLMIVIVGAVNIVSTLVMVVSDKGADIAILRTMGASSRQIMLVFMLQGLLAGAVGTLLGAIAGLLLANGIGGLSLLLERMLNNLLADANVFIPHFQSQIIPIEVLLVCLVALAISFLATLYPAYRASRVNPAEVLRYE